ncbi:MAG: hydroxymethylbilane synthase [Deltaproteobacteria bacterium]|nr:hydroxymethylbilane synthase [Deltaproteobacteria bacterium]
MKKEIVVGTRGSRLAIRQTEIALEELKSVFPDLTFRIKIIKTIGDTIWDKPLFEIGGKGFFIKEIEEALLSRNIDMAIHSMKDVPTELKKGLTIAAILKREDPRDAFVSFDFQNLDELPDGSKIGTSSFRRSAQLLGLGKRLYVVPIRGNVETRIKKIKTEKLSGVILAYCGLKRLGLESYAKWIIPPETIVPSAGQGAIGIEVREDSELLDILEKINDEQTSREVELERKIQMLIGGGCHVPFGVNVESKDSFFILHAFYGSRDGRIFVKIKEKGTWSSLDDFTINVLKKLKSPPEGAEY